MDGWRQMAAQTVPGILAFVGTNTDATECITVAQRKLVARIRVVRLLRRGALPGQIDFHGDDVGDVFPVGVCPTVFILAALHTVGLHVARHAMAGRVLELYVDEHPNLQGTPMWQAWSNDHAHVNVHAGPAVRALRLALALTKESREAVRVAGSSFPRLSAGWTAWMRAAEQLADFAGAETGVAWGELRMMGQAAMGEYGKARILIGD